MPKGIYKRTDEQIKRFLSVRNSFKNGNTVRRGKKLSSEQIERVRLGHIGLKKTEETKHKIKLAQINKKRPQISGCRNHKWKGGVTRKNDLDRKSIEYREWRRDVFIRDEFTCQECGMTETYIEAHHIKSFSDYPELRFDKSNGVTLCKECHKKTENYGAKFRKGVICHQT